MGHSTELVKRQNFLKMFYSCKLYNMQRYTFLVIVQLILIVFSENFEYLSFPRICHYWNDINLLRFRLHLHWKYLFLLFY